MAVYRSSFIKTATIASVSAATGVVVLLVALWYWTRATAAPMVGTLGLGVAAICISAATAWCLLIASGGLIALRRDTLERTGRPYASGEPRESVPNSLLVRCWTFVERGLAALTPDRESLHLRPGELVAVRPLEEILGTLDRSGTLHGVPFMPEMAQYCGTQARVLRRVDKLHDWVNNAGLKRMRNLVLLDGLRCAGTAHGGCQAACHIRWCEAWLHRLPAGRAAQQAARPAPEFRIDLDALTRREISDANTRYVCQATSLAAGGVPLKWSDPRHYVRDLLTGNVRLQPFLTGVALACFNAAQAARGGVRYPRYVTGPTKESPHESLDLQPGELVRVKPKHAIERTLNVASRNRGLRFDPEMLRFCGGEYRVKSRVLRLIVEQTGELRTVTSACIILENITATGEYAAFNPENENIFWREIWLERVGPSP